MNVIAYYRVSTKRQGDSGLGLDAQREYIRMAAESSNWQVVGEFTDTASGTIAPTSREALAAALKACKEHGATLVVAKLDRLSRSVSHIAQLMESVEFKVATMPHADAFQLHIYAALAEQERKFIGQRTKAALGRIKANAEAGDADAQAKIERRDAGRAGGQHKATAASAEVKQIKAMADAEVMRDVIELAISRPEVTSLRGAAAFLNARGKRTAQGSEFTAMTVKRTVERLGLTFP